MDAETLEGKDPMAAKKGKRKKTKKKDADKRVVGVTVLKANGKGTIPEASTKKKSKKHLLKATNDGRNADTVNEQRDRSVHGDDLSRSKQTSADRNSKKKKKKRKKDVDIDCAIKEIKKSEHPSRKETKKRDKTPQCSENPHPSGKKEKQREVIPQAVDHEVKTKKKKKKRKQEQSEDAVEAGEMKSHTEALEADTQDNDEIEEQNADGTGQQDDGLKTRGQESFMAKSEQKRKKEKRKKSKLKEDIEVKANDVSAIPSDKKPIKATERKTSKKRKLSAKTDQHEVINPSMKIPSSPIPTPITEAIRTSPPIDRSPEDIPTKDITEKTATAEKETAVDGKASIMNGNKKQSTGGRTFRRVADEEWLGKAGAWDNSYQATFGDSGWGAKAQRVFATVRGKSFRHEKTKKKRGSYFGGKISADVVRSIKFESDDE